MKRSCAQVHELLSCSLWSESCGKPLACRTEALLFWLFLGCEDSIRDRLKYSDPATWQIETVSKGFSVTRMGSN